MAEPLQVIAVITAEPGGEDAVRAALTTLVAATRQEDGCLSYALNESAVAPGTFVMVESWRSQDDLDAHMTTPHMAAAFAAAGDRMVAPPAIHPLVPVA